MCIRDRAIIDGSHIIGLQTYMIYLIVFNQVIVPGEQDGHMRRVVYLIVGNTVPHS